MVETAALVLTVGALVALAVAAIQAIPAIPAIPAASAKVTRAQPAMPTAEEMRTVQLLLALAQQGRLTRAAKAAETQEEMMAATHLDTLMREYNTAMETDGIVPLDVVFGLANAGIMVEELEDRDRIVDFNPDTWFNRGNR
jgi:hypothetical protein